MKNKLLMFIPFIGIYFRYISDDTKHWYFRISGLVQSISATITGIFIGFYF